MNLLFNLLCRDVQAQMDFYAAVFGFEEIIASRSPIYRGLDTGGSVLGLNAPEARALLNLPAAPAPAADSLWPTTAFATFMFDTTEQVDSTTRQVQCAGGRVLKAPFVTYYNQWQAVCADPEGHVFRLACALPPAADAAMQPAQAHQVSKSRSAT
jgi:predicted enzyme related to lactoylglutathione lyase